MTDEVENTTGEVAPIEDDFTDQSIEDFLASLFGGTFGAAEGVQERFEALVDTVNERMHSLDDADQERDYTVTLTTPQARWVLSAIGWFVDAEVRDNGVAAHALLDAAERLLDATAPVAA